MSEPQAHQALPNARTEKLIVEKAGDELLVYDLETDEAHCLSPTAAAVWRRCDGRTRISDVAALLPADDAAGDAEARVLRALDQLRSCRLLAEADLQIQESGWSRRQFVVRAGAAGAAATAASFITSIPAAQAACKAHCTSCTTGGTGCPAGQGTCCSGLICCTQHTGGGSACSCKCVTAADACTNNGKCNQESCA